MPNLSDVKFFYAIYPPVAGGNHLLNLLSLNNLFHKRFISFSYEQDLINFYKSKENLQYSKQNFEEATQHWDHKFLSSNEFFKLPAIMYNVHPWKFSLNCSSLDPESNSLYTFKQNHGEWYEELRMSYFNVQCHAGYKIEEKNDKIFLLETHGLIKAATVKPPASSDPFIKTCWEHLNQSKNLFSIIMTIPKKGRAYDRIFLSNKAVISKINPKNYTLPYYIFNSNNSIILDTDKFCDDGGSYYLESLLKSELNLVFPSLIHDLHSSWIKMIDNSLQISNV